MKIYLATGNLNKRREAVSIFHGHEVVIPSDEGIDFDPVEDGTSFAENSLIKARALYAVVHAPVLADDSGICVAALGGAPGIYSARYAGPAAPHGNGHKVMQDEQNRMLIEELNEALNRQTDGEGAPGLLRYARNDGKGAPLAEVASAYGLAMTGTGAPLAHFPNGPRSAHYACAMTLYLGEDRYIMAQETMEGTLVGNIKEARGAGGFGYDPIFFLPSMGKTVAELSAEEKNAISHRGKALRIIQRAAAGILRVDDAEPRAAGGTLSVAESIKL